jgi:hypothetical protein
MNQWRKLWAWLPAIVALSTLAATTRPTRALVTINVKTQCGAKGDGVTNDTAAFQQASALLDAAGGGTLEIPSGTYIVGKQNHVTRQYPYYKAESIFAVKNLSSLTINGHGSTLKIAPDLRYGCFDKDTGEPANKGIGFRDWDYAAMIVPNEAPSGATAMGIIAVCDSKNIKVNDLILNGNSTNLIIGGPWAGGTGGIELNGYGFVSDRNTDVVLTNVTCKYNALDGALIAWGGLKLPHADTPHTLENCHFDFNGRQGVSWTGGIGLTARNCTFNSTGRAVNVNPASGGRSAGTNPGAGLDIEAEASVTGKGSFSNCTFNDNQGWGMVSGGGSGGGDATFDHCTFWGVTGWSIGASAPGLKFTGCNIYGTARDVYGSADPAKATSFTNCAFEDKPYTGDGPSHGKVFEGIALVGVENDGDNVTFNNCTFTANQTRSLWYKASWPTETTVLTAFNNCTWVHKWAPEADKADVCIIGCSTINGGKFLESLPAGTTKNYYIRFLNIHVAAKPALPTTIAGPNVHWQIPTAPIVSPIPPGEYTTP